MSSSSRGFDQAVDTLLKHEIRKLNSHLPRRRRTLADLLKEEAPSVESVDGGRIVMRRGDVESLAHIVPEYLRGDLKLPFVVMRRMDMGRSVFVVLGEKLEEFTVKRILGLTGEPYERMHVDEEPLVLYRPHVSELLHKFHSLVVIGFGLPKELSPA